MTFNEINIMDHMPTFAGGVIKNDPQSRAQGVYHQFLASAKAVLLGHEINPNFYLDRLNV